MRAGSDVVITACGVVSPIGTTVPEFERRMFAGDSGVVDVRGRVVGQNFPVPYGALVDDSRVPSARELGISDSVQTNGGRYALYAFEQLLESLPERVEIDGLLHATPAGIFFDVVLESFRGYDPESFDWDQLRAEWIADEMSLRLRQRGYGDIAPEHRICVNSACAAGGQALGLGYQNIKAGRMKRCLVTAVDAGAWESQLMNFHLLHTLMVDEVPAATASRPFSASRGGFVKGEAAAALLLETREAAEERGATILASVGGYAFNSDAYRLTDGREDNFCVVRVMQDALADAGLTPQQIDYINAHGTATLLNDRLETRAIKKVFGVDAGRVPVSSLKSQIGHPTVAAGAVEAIACVLMLQRQKIAPTINLNDPDPDCDLDYVTEGAREADLRHVMSNSFGFGGQNACLVLNKED